MGVGSRGLSACTALLGLREVWVVPPVGVFVPPSRRVQVTAPQQRIICGRDAGTAVYKVCRELSVIVGLRPAGTEQPGGASNQRACSGMGGRAGGGGQADVPPPHLAPSPPPFQQQQQHQRAAAAAAAVGPSWRPHARAASALPASSELAAVSEYAARSPASWPPSGSVACALPTWKSSKKRLSGERGGSSSAACVAARAVMGANDCMACAGMDA
jgi:hypothetical protein